METTAVKMFERTVQYQEDMIWVRPVCDFFGIYMQNQYKKIKNDPVLTDLNANMQSDFGKIDANGRIFLTKKGFLRWIQSINPASVKDSLREKFIKYQKLIFDYLYGSIKEESSTRQHLRRLHKLERLHKLIGKEIKYEKKQIAYLLEHRYQLNLQFDKPTKKIGK